MRKKTAITALLVLTVLALGASSAFAQGVVRVYPFSGEPVTIEEDEQIQLFWFWAATTKGLVRVYLNHFSASIALVDKYGVPVWSMSPEEADLYWGPIETWPIEPGGDWDCAKPTTSSVGWEYTIPRPPNLRPGEDYTLVFTERFDQPVNDGWHTCTWMGVKDVPPPSLYRGTNTYETIITVKP
jgi:hypothetical protein